MLEKILSDPTALGATGLLIIGVVAFYRGMIVPRWIYDQALADCKSKGELIDRLFGQLERGVSATEKVAAAVVSSKKDGGGL